MPKIAKELSALAVSKLQEGAHAVGGVPGLQLQVIGASKVWVLRFALHGKRRRMGLGSYPAVSLASAREADAAVIWMSDGAKVPVDDTQRPAIPLLMTLGALTAGADAFDPGRPVILMTEDKLTQPVTAFAIANGAPPNVAVLSYNGCGNLGAARLLASMITEMRPDARIIIHRDRDFRTDEEMQFEIATAATERERNSVTESTSVL